MTNDRRLKILVVATEVVPFAKEGGVADVIGSLPDALPQLAFAPDIIHLNDWQTAPSAAYLRTNYRHLLQKGATRIVYTVHNLQYQGRWDPSILYEAGLDPASVFIANGLEFWGDVNWMKAGIMYADVVT